MVLGLNYESRQASTDDDKGGSGGDMGNKGVTWGIRGRIRGCGHLSGPEEGGGWRGGGGGWLEGGGQRGHRKDPV